MYQAAFPCDKEPVIVHSFVIHSHPFPCPEVVRKHDKKMSGHRFLCAVHGGPNLGRRAFLRAADGPGLLILRKTAVLKAACCPAAGVGEGPRRSARWVEEETRASPAGRLGESTMGISRAVLPH